jgi:uncharacterized membrane protein
VGGPIQILNSPLPFTYFNTLAHIIPTTKNNFMANNKTWHQKHRESLSFGQRLADSVANRMGSWSFIIIQTIIVIIWMALNLVAYISHWDPYPFILLNLLFSTQAAYAAPVIMMAQNRQNERDRAQASADYETNIAAKKEIETLQIQLNTIDVEKLDKIISMLEEMKKASQK